MDDDACLVVEVEVAELTLALGVQRSVLVRTVMRQFGPAFFMVAVVTHSFRVVLPVFMRTGGVGFAFFWFIGKRRV